MGSASKPYSGAESKIRFIRPAQYAAGRGVALSGQLPDLLPGVASAL